MTRGWRTTLLLASALISVGGCGTSVPTAGIDRSGSPVVAKGPITGFGSIILNGVRYETGNAQIIASGMPVTQANLAVGHVVTVSGSLANGEATAERIVFDPNVIGPIEAIDLTSQTMVVLGQAVLVGDSTSLHGDIEPDDMSGLMVDDIVLVSGLVDSTQKILATYIERLEAGGSFEVTGEAADVDNAAQRFRINDLDVDYTAAMLQGFPNGQPENGDSVRVTGSALDVNGNLIADSVEQIDDSLVGAVGDQVELEGLITVFVSPSEFHVAGVQITTDSGTEFEGGAASDLGLNVRVEIEGEFDASRRVIASKVHFRQQGELRVEAPADAVDAANNSLSVFGVPVEITSLTRVEDKSSLELQPFSLVDVSVGDYVKVRGYESATAPGTLIATRVERHNQKAENKVRAFAEQAIEPTFEVFGISVQTDANTEFEADDDAPLTATEFFAQAEGRLVEAKGIPNGSILLADEAEFKD